MGDLDKQFQVAMIQMNVSLKNLSELPQVIKELSENMNKMSRQLDKTSQNQQNLDCKFDTLSKTTEEKTNRS